MFVDDKTRFLLLRLINSTLNTDYDESVLFKMPSKGAGTIAERACAKYNGKVDRPVAAKTFAEQVVHLFVVAQVHHLERRSDGLLIAGWDRSAARFSAEDRV